METAKLQLIGSAGDSGSIHFTEISPDYTGVDFLHHSGDSREKPFPAANGSGVAAFDYDLDGRYDLYFATGTDFPPNPARERPVNRIYRNLGDWRFEQVTAESGLGHNGYSAGLAVGDYDSDGFPDVYVSCYGANRLYRNLGDGTFVELAATAGVDDDKWGASAAFLDYDADGLLDIYVCNYAKWSLETNQYCGDRKRNVRIFCAPSMVPPERDVCYRNLGDGTFRDVTEETGLAVRLGRGQGVVAADIDGDGWIDLYIGNDGNENSLFLNDSRGGFTDVTGRSGVGLDRHGVAQAGMGVDAADVDRDGRVDLFVTNFENEHNAFYENMGDALFVDNSAAAGLAADGLPWVGWGTVFADFDFDGWLDLIVTNGHVDNNLHEMGRDSPYAEPSLVWKNQAGRFVCAGSSAGGYFSRSHVGRALCLADLDNDGDHDVVIGHQDFPPALLRNERIKRDSGEASFVQLQLVGTLSNRDAFGAELTLHRGNDRMFSQIKGGASYLCAHDLRQVFAAGPGQVEGESDDLRVEIRWPKGQRQTLDQLQPGGRYRLIEPLHPGKQDAKIIPIHH